MLKAARETLCLIIAIKGFGKWLTLLAKSQKKGLPHLQQKLKNFHEIMREVNPTSSQTNRILSELPLLLTSYAIKSTMAYRGSQVCHRTAGPSLLRISTPGSATRLRANCKMRAPLSNALS